MATERDIKELMQGEEFDRRGELLAVGEAAMPLLIRILQNTTEPTWMRQRALIVLAQMRAASAVPAIEMQLAAQDPVVRLSAIRALVQIQGADAVPRLLPLLGDSDPGVCKVAMQCLGDIGNTDALEALNRAKESAPHEALIAVAEQAIDTIKKRSR